MLHGSDSNSVHRSNWYRWTLALLILCTLLFGAWGQWRYELAQHPGHFPDGFSVFYHACQLLLAHGAHLEGSVPWQLHLGRLLGTLALFTTGLLAFTRFFKNETLQLRLWLPWRRDHVVICGLGDLGLRLVLDARRRGKFVVAIEKQGAARSIEQARKVGAYVIEGDACDAATLRRTRVHRAEFVIAACQNDTTNVAIAASVGRMLSIISRRDRPLICRLLVHDVELRRLLERESVLATATSSTKTGANYHVNFQELHLHNTAARQALRQYPLDFQPILVDSDKTVHLVVVGFGPMGQNLALHAARIGHFANGVTKYQRIRTTVVDRDAQASVDAFRIRYPKIDRICEFVLHEVDPHTEACRDKLDELVRDAAARKELVTIAVCVELKQIADDRENLRIGLELSRRVKDQPAQVLIYQSTRSGFAALFPIATEGKGISVPLHAFGMIEDIYTWDVLLRESEDRLARAIHEDYAENHSKESTAKEWDVLEDHFKESNRQAADHIPIKLRALGYRDAPLQEQSTRIEQFKPEEFELLRQMEHRRWCAERWLGGWEFGPETIREKKINKNLVRWDELSPLEQQKDHEQIEAIARVLYGIGRGIYR